MYNFFKKIKNCKIKMCCFCESQCNEVKTPTTKVSQNVKTNISQSHQL